MENVEKTTLIQSVWPDWTVIRKLGEGSYGAVYEARKHEHQVEFDSAIKVVSIPKSQSELDAIRAEGMGEEGTRSYLSSMVDNFVGEIQLMESLKGVQNIVSVEDYKVIEHHDQMAWDILIRMELLTPFTTYKKTVPLTEEMTIRLGIDICRALERCSIKKIIHRDIKPENIFVNDFGDFKLGDFGIARQLENMSSSLSQKGTYNYLAPEIERGTNYDERVDIYSLGIVLYRMVNYDRLPFLDSPQKSQSPTERTRALRRRLTGEVIPPPAQASPRLAAIILKACSFYPEKRYKNAAHMRRDLEMALAGLSAPPVSTRVSAPAPRPQTAPQTNGTPRPQTSGAPRVAAPQTNGTPRPQMSGTPRVAASQVNGTPRPQVGKVPQAQSVRAPQAPLNSTPRPIAATQVNGTPRPQTSGAPRVAASQASGTPRPQMQAGKAPQAQSIRAPQAPLNSTPRPIAAPQVNGTPRPQTSGAPRIAASQVNGTPRPQMSGTPRPIAAPQVNGTPRPQVAPSGTPRVAATQVNGTPRPQANGTPRPQVPLQKPQQPLQPRPQTARPNVMPRSQQPQQPQNSSRSQQPQQPQNVQRIQQPQRPQGTIPPVYDDKTVSVRTLQPRKPQDHEGRSNS